MTQKQDYDCDRCEASIIADSSFAPQRRRLVVKQTEHPQSQDTHERLLCTGCQTELLQWIDDGVDARDEKVDLIHDRDVSKDLAQVGNRLQEISDVLEAHNQLNMMRRK